jgi:hypothetical protein
MREFSEGQSFPTPTPTPTLTPIPIPTLPLIPIPTQGRGLYEGLPASAHISWRALPVRERAAGPSAGKDAVLATPCPA